MIRKITILTLSTFFYVGYLPFIPGTFGSIAAILLFYLIKGNLFTYILLTAILLIIGFLVAGQAERILNRKDAPCIVIDEVGGIFLSFLFLPLDIKIIVIGFLLFRLLDAIKPYPADRLQRIKGSVGIMSDDIVAGFYTNIILQVVCRFASFKIS